MALIEGIERSPLYTKTELYLREYNIMQARVKNIEIDLKVVYEWRPETHDETIAGMMFARSKTEGSPASGSHGDKTLSVAIRHDRERSKDIYNAINELTDDRGKLEYEKAALIRLLTKIDNAITSLSGDEQLIIKSFYIQQKPWYDVAHEVQYVERHCKRLRTRAIWHMSKSIFGVGKVRN